MKRIIVLTALALAGCGDPTKQPPPVEVTALPDAKVRVPAECKTADPKWKGLPKDARLSDFARNYEENHRSYDKVVGSRNVCRSGVTALERG